MAFAQMSDAELVHNLLDNERELIAARMRHSMNQLENTAGLKVLRRNIARMHTEARRREVEQGLRRDTLLHTHRQSYTAGAVGEGEGADKGGFLSGIVDKISASE